jgi:hypothetical protein
MSQREELGDQIDAWARAMVEALDRRGVDRYDALPEEDKARLYALAVPIWPALARINSFLSQQEVANPDRIFKELWPELDLSEEERQGLLAWALATASIEVAVKRRGGESVSG